MVRDAAPIAGNTRWFIFTPDDDSDEEDLVVGTSISQVFPLDSWRAYPARLLAGNIYKFRAGPTAARSAALVVEVAIHVGVVAAPAGFMRMLRVVPAALARGVRGGGVDVSAAVFVDAAVVANKGEKRMAQGLRESPGDGGPKSLGISLTSAGHSRFGLGALWRPDVFGQLTHAVRLRF